MRNSRELFAAVLASALVTASACNPSDTSASGRGAIQPSAVSPPNASTIGGAGANSPNNQLATAEPGTTGSPSTAPGAPTASGVPCDVAPVISNNCTLCHASVPVFGAPMPLMTYADFHAAAKSDPSKKVYELIPARVGATDITKRMPPASQPALGGTDLQALTQWTSTGAIPSATACAISANSGAGPAASPATPPPLGTHSGGAGDQPISYDDPLMKCYQFLSHASSDKTQPFSVSTQPDLYTNFDFAAPWTGTVYARSLKKVIGNMQVIHHWILYKDDAPVTDGAISTSSGAHPNGQFVQGWAPGGSDIYFDPDVAVELPSTVGYTLETHHNNTTGAAAPDASGIELCVTPTPPKNIASIAYVGTDAINGTTATGTCMPTSNVPAHIIGGSPHMHPKGTRMTVIVTRADGTQETLHDAPFDFNYQHSYPDTTIINPGDSMATTCYYDAPATFGSSTKSEMCYYFTLYYPPLALTNNNPLGVAVHGPNSCM